ncbi:flavin reductase family protein [Elusimicrobiota bacterium]
MSDYIYISLDEAYRLINHGPLLLISTCGEDGRYDIAPIAWNCPVEKSPARVLIVVGKGHQTFKNIRDSKEFIACVPSSSQYDMVRKTGSVSGRDHDKFTKYNIDYIEGNKVNAMVPVGCVGFIECNVDNIIEEEDVGIIVGEAVKAYADNRGFSDRVLPENKEGETLHHLGGGIFGVLSEKIIDL